ncbi:ATP-binding protein [Candidatus Microgenomates bacterium]|nr:ATP-binding protein [Candidatus Microgenomates bacterium]
MNIEAQSKTHPFLKENVELKLEKAATLSAAEYFLDKARLLERMKIYDPGLYNDIRLIRHEMIQPLAFIAGVGKMLAIENPIKFKKLESASDCITTLSDIFHFRTALAGQLFTHNSDPQLRHPHTVLLTDKLVKTIGLRAEVSGQLKSRLAAMERRELAGWVVGEMVKSAETIGRFVDPKNYLPSDIPFLLRTEIPSLRVKIAKVVDVFPFLQVQLTEQAYQRRDGDEPLDFWRIVEESKDQFNWKAVLVSGWDEVTDYVRRLRFKSDPGLLRIILENLFRNAYRYSDKYIHVNFWRLNQIGELIIVVSNDGLLVPYEEQSRVWEKGQRGSNTTQEGSGFGLFLVRKAAEALGGKSCLESNLTINGPRTHVIVTLPIED